MKSFVNIVDVDDEIPSAYAIGIGVPYNTPQLRINMETRGVVITIPILSIQVHPLRWWYFRSWDLEFLGSLSGTGQNTCQHNGKQSYF